MSHHMIQDGALNVKCHNAHTDTHIHTNTPFWVHSVCYGFDTRAAGAMGDNLVSVQRLRGSADLGGDEGGKQIVGPAVLKCKAKQAAV